MHQEAFVYGLSVVAVAVGLAVLLVGEAVGNTTAIPVGGAVIILGLCGLVGYTAALDG